MPTGGIVLSNLNDYLNLPNVWHVVFSRMVRSELINKAALKKLLGAKEALNLSGFKVAHIGINT